MIWIFLLAILVVGATVFISSLLCGETICYDY